MGSKIGKYILMTLSLDSHRIDWCFNQMYMRRIDNGQMAAKLFRQYK
jgi:hypothetical protein